MNSTDPVNKLKKTFNNLFTLIQGNAFTHEATRWRLAGDFYNETAVVPSVIVPSHIDGARRDQSIKFLKLKPGQILYNYCQPWDDRPWIGDYFAFEKYLPSELGISDTVSRVAKEGEPFTKEVSGQKVIEKNRLLIKVVLLEEVVGMQSTASSCIDNWSKYGEKISVPGGATQIFVPTAIAHKKERYNVLLSDFSHLPEEEKTIAEASEIRIAKMNGMATITKAELSKMQDSLQLDSTNSSKPYASSISLESSKDLAALNDRLDTAISLWKIDEALNVLRSIENLKTPPTSEENAYISLIRVALLYTSGSREEAKLFLSLINLKHIELEALHLTALCQESVDDKITLLKNLLPKKNEAGSSAKVGYAHLDYVYLNLAQAYLKKAAKEPMEISILSDFDSNGEKILPKFDSNGKQIEGKGLSAAFAQEFIERALEHGLEGYPKIIALGEKCLSLRMQGNYSQAILKSLEMIGEINIIIEGLKLDGSLYPKQLQDLEMERDCLKLGLGLSLAWLKTTEVTALLQSKAIGQINELVDKTFSSEDNLEAYRSKVVSFLWKVTDDLAVYDIITTRLLIHRWLGETPYDLFIRGWVSHPKANGESLIGWYRSHFPIDVNKICTQLRENTITHLDLPYMRATGKIGLSDEDFLKIMTALKENRSLTSINVRKTLTQDNTQINRSAEFFTALKESKCQLTHLDISASHFIGQDPFDRCLEYLDGASTLKVFRPSLYYWRDSNFDALCERFRELPHLKSLILGMLTSPGAGVKLSTTLEKIGDFQYLYPFPYRIMPDRQVISETHKKMVINTTILLHAAEVLQGKEGGYNPDMAKEFLAYTFPFSETVKSAQDTLGTLNPNSSVFDAIDSLLKGAFYSAMANQYVKHGVNESRIASTFNEQALQYFLNASKNREALGQEWHPLLSIELAEVHHRLGDLQESRKHYLEAAKLTSPSVAEGNKEWSAIHGAACLNFFKIANRTPEEDGVLRLTLEENSFYLKGYAQTEFGRLNADRKGPIPHGRQWTVEGAYHHGAKTVGSFYVPMGQCRDPLTV